jgi:glycerol-3-phosphate dehydrogenase subunit B
VTARVLVAGGGAAGLAAAWFAQRGGHAVTLVSAGAGASALGGGAVDDAPWEMLLRAARLLGAEDRARALAPDLRAFVEDLGIWDVPEAAPVWLATVAGRVRPARGRERGLLDLSPLTGKTVLLPRAERAAWDADALAATLSADPVAIARRISFRAVDAAVLRFDEERRVADGDLALRHDDAGRIGWLAERLRAALATAPGAGAILIGPWLGAAAPRAEALSQLVGVPVGEALTGAGSPAGMRFEAARDAMLRRLDVRRERGRVEEVQSDGSGMAAIVGGATIAADAVVLAVGGIAGGGVVYAPPEHQAGADLPPRGDVPFALSVRAPVALSIGGAARMEIVGSMSGPELDRAAWPTHGRPGALESVGVQCEGARAGDGIYAAGDVVAGRARTLLEAAAAGIAAARAATGG